MGGERQARRFARRLQLRFSKRGDRQTVNAYTTNISTTGMFIATSTPLPPSTRLRIELPHEGEVITLEAEVVHAARVSPLLKKLKASGMGVRFLTVAELVTQIVPDAGLAEDEPGAHAGAASREAGPEPAAAAEKPAGAQEEPAAESSEREPSPGAAAGVSGDSSDPPPPKLPEPRQSDVIRLAFDSLPRFLEVMKRDIAAGGIFVPGAPKAALDEMVTVEIQIPAPVDRSVRVAGRVVQVVDAETEEGPLPAGVGIQLVEPQSLVRRLEAMVYAD